MAETLNTKPFYNTAMPSDWKVKSLKQLGSFSKGKGILKSQLSENGYPCVRYGEIYTTHHYVINEFKSFVNEEISKESVEIKKGDILFAGSGETIDEIGKSVAYMGDEKAFAGGDVIILSTKENINAECVSYALETDIARKQKRRLGQGQQVVHIYPSDLSKINILIPPLPEQRAIAKALSLMDSAINQNNQLIAQKELRKKWLMQNLLTGKKRLNLDLFDFSDDHDFKNNEKSSESFNQENHSSDKGKRLGNEKFKIKNEKWISVRLRDAFEFVRSYSISRDGLTISGSENLIYCIHYGDIHAFYESDFLDFSEQKSIPQILKDSFPISESDFLKDGDIIIADASEDYNGVGEAVEVKNIKDKLAVGGLHTIVLRGKSGIIANGFRGYLFASERVRNTLRKFANGTSVYSVSKTILQNLSLIIPNSIKEQTAIAQVLQAADKEIALLKAKTEKLREQKKGMMQVLLTGKKRLNYDSSDFYDGNYSGNRKEKSSQSNKSKKS